MSLKSLTGQPDREDGACPGRHLEQAALCPARREREVRHPIHGSNLHGDIAQMPCTVKHDAHQSNLRVLDERLAEQGWKPHRTSVAQTNILQTSVYRYSYR